jgi:hypothetical protein
LEAIVRRNRQHDPARWQGFDEIRAEIESAVEADERTRERRFEALGKRIADVETHLDHVEEKVDTPDWRQRR